VPSTPVPPTDVPATPTKGLPPPTDVPTANPTKMPTPAR
jgi:hypothetical protein